MTIRGLRKPDLPEDTEYYPDFDVDDYVRGILSELDEILGPDPEIRLAVAENEVHTIVRGMLWAYGVDGVEIATKRLRSSVDMAERNALMSNGADDDAEEPI